MAKEHNLTIISPGQSFTPATQNTAGQIHLAEAFNSWLEPAPVSPTTLDVPAWRVFAATSRGVYRSRPAAMRHRNGDLEGDELVMAPYMATGVRHRHRDQLASATELSGRIPIHGGITL